MLRFIKHGLLACLMMFLLSSCYSYTAVVGNGPQQNQEVKRWNHYLINGLIPVGVTNPKQLAGGSDDYAVEVKHSFANLLVGGLTLGIYSPTTTKVTR